MWWPEETEREAEAETEGAELADCDRAYLPAPEVGYYTALQDDDGDVDPGETERDRDRDRDRDRERQRETEAEAESCLGESGRIRPGPTTLRAEFWADD